MLKNFLIVLVLIFPTVAAATSLSVANARVTTVQVYETTDNSTSVWIHLNGSSRVGPNPVNASVTCELWTNDRNVHSIALSALVSGNKVTVSYVDRGQGTYWCQVQTFAISSE